MSMIKRNILCLAVVGGVFGGEVMAQAAVVCVPPSYKDPQAILDCAIQLAVDNSTALTALGLAQTAKRACDAQADSNDSIAISDCRSRWSNNPGQLASCLALARATNTSALNHCSATMQSAQTAYNAAVRAALDKYNSCVANAPCLTPIPVDGTVPPLPAERSQSTGSDVSHSVADPILQLGLVDTLRYELD